jgi:hypothetical protein
MLVDEYRPGRKSLEGKMEKFFSCAGSEAARRYQPPSSD